MLGVEERETADPRSDLIADCSAVVFAVLTHHQVEVNKGSVKEPSRSWLFEVAGVAAPATDLVGEGFEGDIERLDCPNRRSWNY